MSLESCPSGQGALADIGQKECFLDQVDASHLLEESGYLDLGGGTLRFSANQVTTTYSRSYHIGYWLPVDVAQRMVDCFEQDSGVAKAYDFFRQVDPKKP